MVVGEAEVFVQPRLVGGIVAGPQIHQLHFHILFVLKSPYDAVGLPGIEKQRNWSWELALGRPAGGHIGI